MAETAAALGHPPQALAELAAFRRTAPMPLSADTIDLGLRGGPSLETLALAAPDLILSSSYYSFAEARLAGIAPVFSRPLFVPGGAAAARLIAATQDLATRLGTPRPPAPCSPAAAPNLPPLPGASRKPPPRPVFWSRSATPGMSACSAPTACFTAR
ncbi:hypothetical protein ACTTAM_19750 (plasmid) [Rhodobacter capsulatus]|uniref:hypothetical protein n=1 Tax=Rhodobacter capsulatus TaxID=1061 RepID=UPI004025FB97